MCIRPVRVLIATLLGASAQAGLLTGGKSDLTLRPSGFALGYGAVDTSRTKPMWTARSKVLPSDWRCGRS